MTNRDFATGRLTPEGLPRLGHWRRPGRSRAGGAFGAATGVAEAPVQPPRPASPAPNGLSTEEEAALAELDITPDPAWFTAPAPAAAPPSPARQPPAVPPAAAPQPDHLVHDMLPEARPAGPAVERDRPDYGLGRYWGATWEWTAQGWVDREGPNPTWRPVVTTTAEVSNWEHDTYLGVVTGEAAVRWVADTATLGRALAAGRETAMRGMVDAGVARGAHAVVGVDVSYTEVEGTVLVTATGTAVTLRER